jgi:threonine/homoserine/homoserine lactone efflux protein
VDPLFVAYITFTFVLVITPGSTTAIVVRNTLAGGSAGGIAAAAGAAVGNSTHATAAGVGLALVFARWPSAMTGLRIAGALFLAWLGAQSLYRAARYEDGGLRVLSATADDEPEGAEARSRSVGFRQGLVVNLLNPAIATFYLVVVPSFLPAGAPRWYFAGLAAIHVTMAFACHSLWAVGLDRLRRLFRPPLARRLLEAATGIALAALALLVAIRQ